MSISVFYSSLKMRVKVVSVNGIMNVVFVAISLKFNNFFKKTKYCANIQVTQSIITDISMITPVST